MTDYAKVEAGSDLDRLIAYRVMGWRVHSRCTAFYVMAGQENEVIVSVPRNVRQWRPSTDIVDAAEVVDAVSKLVRDGKAKIDCHGDGDVWFSVDAPRSIAGDGKGTRDFWRAGFRNWYDHEGEGWCFGQMASAGTAPLAICRAALATVTAQPPSP